MKTLVLDGQVRLNRICTGARPHWQHVDYRHNLEQNIPCLQPAAVGKGQYTASLGKLRGAPTQIWSQTHWACLDIPGNLPHYEETFPRKCTNESSRDQTAWVSFHGSGIVWATGLGKRSQAWALPSVPPEGQGIVQLHLWGLHTGLSEPRAPNSTPEYRRGPVPSLLWMAQAMLATKSLCHREGSPWSVVVEVPGDFFWRGLHGFSGVQKVPAQQAPLNPVPDPSPEGDFREEADAIHWVRSFIQSQQPNAALSRDWPFMMQSRSRAETMFGAKKEDRVGSWVGRKKGRKPPCEDITQLWGNLEDTRLCFNPPTWPRTPSIRQPHSFGCLLGELWRVINLRYLESVDMTFCRFTTCCWSGKVSEPGFLFI